MSYEENPRGTYAYDDNVWRRGAQYDTYEGDGLGDGCSAETLMQVLSGNARGDGGIGPVVDEEDNEIITHRHTYESWRGDVDGNWDDYGDYGDDGDDT